MLLIRLAGLFFAIVQITLALRLVLPFVDVPTAFEGWVPTIIDVTDIWIAPVLTVAENFELTGLAEDLAPAGGSLIEGPDEFEPVVPLAMVAWAVVAMFVLFVLRLLFRPEG